MDTNKLKICMLEKNYTQKKMSEELGITVQSFNAKLNQHKQFKLDEIMKIVSILSIDDPADVFFFNISNMQQKRSDVNYISLN